MVVHAETSAQSIGLFIRGTHADGNFIELLAQYQYETSGKLNPEKNFWILHACIFRVMFGHWRAGEMIDPRTGIWTYISKEEPTTVNAVQEHVGALASTQHFPEKIITEIRGLEAIQTAEQLKPTSGADRLDVRRVGLAEVRVASFHISSFAWRNAYKEVCEKWTYFISSCCTHHVDFNIGDGNLFARRNFKQDQHSDCRTCILIDLFERFLTQINANRSALYRITYSSTQAGEYIRAQEGAINAACDSMLTISLCYGKQTVVVEERASQESASADGYVGSAYDDKVLLNDAEQPKHLLVYDQA